MNTVIIVTIIICLALVIINLTDGITEMYKFRQNRLWFQYLSDNDLYQDDKGLVYPIDHSLRIRKDDDSDQTR